MKKTISKSFKRFLISYLIILMIPVIIGVYAYDKTVGLLEEDAKNANLSILNQSKETLDIRLKELEQIATELALNPKILQLLNVNPPFTDSEYYQIYEVLMDVKKYHINQFISDYYLHLPESKLLITRRTMYQLPESYGMFFQYGQLEYEEWLEKFKFDGRLNRYFSAEDIYYNGRHQDMITFQKMIFPGYTKEARGSVFVIFPKKEIENMFDHLQIENGWAYILDDHGDILYETEHFPLEKPKFDSADMEGTGYFYYDHHGEKLFISYTTSANNNWKYVAAIPSETLLSKANYIQRITFIVLLLSIITGVIFALFMASKNSKPMRELMETIKEFISGDQTVKGNDIELIKGTITELVKDHHHLKTSFEKQIPFLQSGFFYRLFNGDFKDAKELSAIASQLKVSVVGDTWVVMTLRFSGYEDLVSDEILDEINRNKIIVKSALNKIKMKQIFVHDTNDDRLSILLCWHEKLNTERLRQQIDDNITQMQSVLREEAGIPVHIGIGGTYHDPLEIWKSYNEAEKALEYGTRIQQFVFWHMDLPLESKLYYYPTDLEIRLINTVRSGNQAALQQLFHHIEENNFEKRKLQTTVIKQLMFELNGTMLKILDSMNQVKEEVYTWIIEMDRNQNVLENYEQIKRSFFDICQHIKRERQDLNVMLINQMKHYIETNYSEYHISLSSMANHFQLSESYASTFFKEHTNENFSSYLESVRMKEARKLLIHTKSSINEIALKVGYSSDKAFRRAFKRFTGILPTEYRNMNSDMVQHL